MKRVLITIGDIRVMGTLDDSNTAQLLGGTVPFESTAQLWGDEVYFQAPVETGEENARADVPSGTVAYWPPGKALCLFFGQTPYSPVNVVGQIEGDPEVLSKVTDGEPVRVESA